jgi:hypothetical protein
VGCGFGDSIGIDQKYIAFGEIASESGFRLHHHGSGPSSFENACQKPLAEMIQRMVEAYVDAKMERADISVALYRVAADVGGPALIKRVNQRSRKAVEAMLETAPDTASPPDKYAVEIMLSAMAGVMRSLLEARPLPATARKAREQLVLLCQSYMEAATAKRI